MKNLLVLLVCIMCLGCAKKQPQPKELVEEERLCPHALIYVQPYEDFTKEEAIKLIPILQKEFDTWLDGAWEFKVLDPISLPEGCKVPVNKYVAVRILSKQNEQPLKNNELILGLTHKDLCANVHGVQNYGIVGQSFSPGKVCVVSDKRLKDKSVFWKPILHEFMHAFYGAKHCKNDDPTCFMVDAKGHGTFNIQDKLCDSCKPK